MSGRSRALILTALAVALQGQTVRSRIINGKPVGSDEYQYVLALRIGSNLCTGTAIGPYTILTAAHCVAGRKDFADVQYETGETVSDNRGNDAKRICWGEYLNDHSEFPYDPKTYLNDIGLFFTDVEITGPYATLPHAFLDPRRIVGHAPTFVGYGLNTRPPGKSETPTEMTLRVQAEATSLAPKKIHAKSKALININETDDWKLYFTSNLQDSSSATTCLGDSGGPALFGKTVVGVTSGGDSGCVVGFATRVDAYLPWLRAHAKDWARRHECKPHGPG